MNDDPRSDGPHIDDTARRVQDAVTAHGRSVQPDEDGSLPVIRQRVASARRRRLAGATALGAAAALVIGVAIGVAAGGDDTTTVAVGDGGSTTTTGPCAPSTPSSSTTTTTAPSTASIPTTSTAPTDSAAAGGSPTTIVPANAPLTAAPETTIPAPGQSDEELTEDRAEEKCAGPTTGTVPTTGTTTTAAPSTTTRSPTPWSVPHQVGLPLPPDQVPPVAWRRSARRPPTASSRPSVSPTRRSALAYDRSRCGARHQLERTETRAGRCGASSPSCRRPPRVRARRHLYGHWAVHAATIAAIVIDGLGIEVGRAPTVQGGQWITGRGPGLRGDPPCPGDRPRRRRLRPERVVTASGGEELCPSRPSSTWPARRAGGHDRGHERQRRGRQPGRHGRLRLPAPLSAPVCS